MNTNISVLSNNFFTIANNIHRGANSFRIEKIKDGSEVIKKNGLLKRYFPFYSSKKHTNQLDQLIKKNVQLASNLEREKFVEGTTDEPTQLFLAIQKYNQTIANSNKHPLLSSSALVNRVKLDLVHHDKISEINPSQVIALTDEKMSPMDEKDKPQIVKERRFFKKYQIRRYPGDTIDHAKEANRIFISTQKERLLSAIGRVIETVGRLFKFEVTTFQKYHYRKNNETDNTIYSLPTSPLSLAKEPTSYWFGHATLMLNIPLKSKNGSVASFNVMTDPVEGDLQSLLYPRQTKFARSIKETPAPDVYLLSHNHLDHFSKESVKKIFAQQPIMIVPKGDRSRYSKLAKECGFDSQNIFELDWWQKKDIEFEKNGERYHMQITATPARHWSGQGPCGGHESTFLGYVIQGNEEGDIYFAGDTARLNGKHLQKLKKNFNIRWNFQPGGPDEVRNDMKSTHQASVDGLWVHFKLTLLKVYEKGMEKEEFLKQAKEFKTIYMHTMTYKLGNLHLSDTKESLEKVLVALNTYEKSDDQLKRIQQKIKAFRNKMRETKSYKELSETKRRKIDQRIGKKETEVLNQLVEKEIGLKSYEKQVYDEICQFARGLEFADEKKILPNEVSELLNETVIVPKIGSRLNLKTQKIDQLENVYF